LQGVKNYQQHIIATKTDKKFIKHPTTFLNSESFNNQYPESKNYDKQDAYSTVFDRLKAKANGY
jgi:surface antigen